jgi:hypothetical protein
MPAMMVEGGGGTIRRPTRRTQPLPSSLRNPQPWRPPMSKPGSFRQLGITPQIPRSIAARPSRAVARPAIAPARPAPRIASNPLGQMSSLSMADSGGGVVAPPPTPAMPNDTDYLMGDTAYQSQRAALDKALRDYELQTNQQRSQYDVDYGARVNELGIAKREGQRDLENDFASRGLLQSGLFFNNQTDFDSMMGRRQGDLDRARGDFASQLEQALANYRTENTLTDTRAKQEALARRAAQYGL